MQCHERRQQPTQQRNYEGISKRLNKIGVTFLIFGIMMQIRHDFHSCSKHRHPDDHEGHKHYEKLKRLSTKIRKSNQELLNHNVTTIESSDSDSDSKPSNHHHPARIEKCNNCNKRDHASCPEIH